MNKNKLVMCIIGGVALVAALALGYLSFSAWQEKEEKLDELEASKGGVERIKRSAVAPTEASLKAIGENRHALAGWRDEAYAAASRGDRAVDAVLTPEAFKRLLGDEAREEAHKPGGVEGRLVRDEFPFGFKDLIYGGSMPDRSELPFLQRQWGDVKFLADTLSESGVLELVDVTIAARQSEEAADRSKRGAKGRKAEPEKKPLADAQGYEIKFLARPTAFVRVLNALATADRFVVVDSLTCQREDTLAAALGEKDKDAPRTTGRKGRGKRRTAEAEAQEGGEEGEASRRKGLVTDPATDAPFTVTMKLTTYDFGSQTAPGTEAKEVEE